MKIHTTSQNEHIKDISEKYGVHEEIIKKINRLNNSEPAVGEELLIQLPTRTYRTVWGDTVDRIALRFGLKKNDIYALNPWMINEELTPGQTLILKASERKLGIAVANGYFYHGCTIEKLKQSMPYLTYVSFASAKANETGISKIFDCTSEVKLCSEQNKIPLIRLFDSYPERYKRSSDLTGFAKELISLAIDGGFKGIVLDSCSLSVSAKEFSAFLMILRKMMIGCDLILITEINENSPIEFSEYADGSVLYYPKYALDDISSFAEGERRILGDFACQGESAKTFIDIPSLVISERGFLNVDEAIDLARHRGYPLETNKSTLLSHFRDRKQGDCRFTSLSGIESLLKLMNEFDYMGICFDIMRTPLSYLVMYNSMFKTSYYVNVSSREGCSRGVEE